MFSFMNEPIEKKDFLDKLHPATRLVVNQLSMFLKSPVIFILVTLMSTISVLKKKMLAVSKLEDHIFPVSQWCLLLHQGSTRTSSLFSKFARAMDQVCDELADFEKERNNLEVEKQLREVSAYTTTNFSFKGFVSLGYGSNQGLSKDLSMNGGKLILYLHESEQVESLVRRDKDTLYDKCSLQVKSYFYFNLTFRLFSKVIPLKEVLCQKIQD